jgi:hypothetical protein
MITRGKPKKLGEKPASVQLHPPRISHEVTGDSAPNKPSYGWDPKFKILALSSNMFQLPPACLMVFC